MASIRIEVMVKYLKYRTRPLDKAIFTKWMYNKMTTEECISEFRKNNNITERMPIIEDEFVEWLGSLGYRRNSNGKTEAIN